MPTIPNRPNMPGRGWRQQRAAQLRAEAEAEERIQRAPAEGQVGLGDDRMHCVQEGESLESIADVHNCSPESIRNHSSNAELSTQDNDACTLTPGANVYIPAEDEQPPQPVGQGEHVVKQGECISSIAKDTGHFWETIWNDPANEELKEVRENPNVLLPGDRVTIPELRRKEEPREAEQRHRFLRRGEPTMLRLRVLKDPGGTTITHHRLRDPDNSQAIRLDAFELDQASRQSRPWANEPYTLELDGKTIEGVTSPNGDIDVPITGNDRQAILVVGQEPDIAKYHLHLGRLEPVETLKGVQQRLNNLGYGAGPVDGVIGPKTRGALSRFQRDHQLRITRSPNDQTRRKLMERHVS